MSPYKDFRSENKDLIKTAVVITFFSENCMTKTTLNFTQNVIDDIFVHLRDLVVHNVHFTTQGSKMNKLNYFCCLESETTDEM